MNPFLRLLAAALFAAALLAQSSQKQLDIASFEHVWKTIRDKHWDPRPGGLDWQAVHDEFRPRIDKAQTTEEARAIMREMLARLKQTHFNIFAADLYADVEHPGGDGSPGLDVRVIGGQALVTEVDSESSAAKAGVRTGWQILKIGNTELAPIIQKVSAAYKDSTLKDLYLMRAVLSRLSGYIGSEARVEFLDGAGQRRELSLRRAQPRGNLTRFGFLPPSYVWVESKKLGSTGYIRFNMFLDLVRVMAAFEDAVRGCQHCDGIIIDVRGNPGGIGGMAMGMAGWLIAKPNLQLGTMYMRDATLKFVVNPRAEVFRGPVAILVDGASASTSEIFAGGMKDLGRARIFGTRTAAAALPSIIEELPNGDGFQYATANYISEGGKPLEAVGVIPDVEVKLTREALLAGRDPAMEAALQWIESQRKSK